MNTPNEHHHEEEVVVKSTRLMKCQSAIMMMAALMISAGQWSDTKEIVTSSYEAIVENFTHTLQYELLEKIHIGNSMAYVKSLVGEPNVIKRSTIDPNVTFQYFNDKKFNLTLLSADGRLVGYSVFPREDGFTPRIPFAEELGSQAIASAHNKPSSYNYDIGNLVYFVESQDLGKEQMFLTLSRGYVEYGASANVEYNGALYTQKITQSIEALDAKETFSESEAELLTAVNDVRAKIYPNFYAVTELSNAIISEALLTRYEYKTFTKS